MNGMELLLALVIVTHPVTFFLLVLDIRGGIYWQEQGASIV